MKKGGEEAAKRHFPVPHLPHSTLEKSILHRWGFSSGFFSWENLYNQPQPQGARSQLYRPQIPMLPWQSLSSYGARSSEALLHVNS
jgi:hypothetical protein